MQYIITKESDDNQISFSGILPQPRKGSDERHWKLVWSDQESDYRLPIQEQPPPGVYAGASSRNFASRTSITLRHK